MEPTANPPPPTPPSETPPSATPPPPPPPNGRSWGRIALIVGGVIVLVLIIASLGRSDDPEASPSQVAGGSPSEAPPESAAPEPSTVSTPALAAGPDFAAVSLSGTGDSVPTFSIGEYSAAIAQITHNGASNFAIWSLAADGSQNDLLVNVIGSYSGTVLFDEDPGVHSVALEVTADGAWTVLIQPVTAARPYGPWDGSSALNGSGDDVVQINPPISGFVTATIQHTGESNFAIVGYSASGADLMVNVIGPYLGEVPIASGTFLLEVSADGAWTITPS